MTSDEQPSQPLNANRWAMMSDKFIEPMPSRTLTDACPTCSGPTRETTHMICLECGTDYAATPPRKLTDNALEVLRAGLAEVDRIRAELSEERQELHVIRVAANMYDKGDDPLTLTLRHDGESLGTRIAELLSIAQHDRNTAVGTTLGHLAKIERLQSQRDALVRKLGLDWGPDEFGDLSAVHVQSIEITNCPDEYCPGWKDSGICPNDYRHRY